MEDITEDGTHSLRAVDAAFVGALSAENGWEPADPASSEAWVDPVLDRVARGEQLAALRSPTMRRTGPVDGQFELMIEWAGEPYLDVYVRRRKSYRRWTLYAHVQFPPEDETGLHRIDFTPQRFDALASAWVEREFDPAEAARRLAAAGR